MIRTAAHVVSAGHEFEEKLMDQAVIAVIRIRQVRRIHSLVLAVHEVGLPVLIRMLEIVVRPLVNVGNQSHGVCGIVRIANEYLEVLFVVPQVSLVSSGVVTDRQYLMVMI